MSVQRPMAHRSERSAWPGSWTAAIGVKSRHATSYSSVVCLLDCADKGFSPNETNAVKGSFTLNLC